MKCKGRSPDRGRVHRRNRRGCPAGVAGAPPPALGRNSDRIRLGAGVDRPVIGHRDCAAGGGRDRESRIDCGNSAAFGGERAERAGRYVDASGAGSAVRLGVDPEKAGVGNRLAGAARHDDIAVAGRQRMDARWRPASPAGLRVLIAVTLPERFDDNAARVCRVVDLGADRRSNSPDSRSLRAWRLIPLPGSRRGPLAPCFAHMPRPYGPKNVPEPPTVMSPLPFDVARTPPT